MRKCFAPLCNLSGCCWNYGFYTNQFFLSSFPSDRLIFDQLIPTLGLFFNLFSDYLQSTFSSNILSLLLRCSVIFSKIFSSSLKHLDPFCHQQVYIFCVYNPECFQHMAYRYILSLLFHNIPKCFITFSSSRRFQVSLKISTLGHFHPQTVSSLISMSQRKKISNTFENSTDQIILSGSDFNWCRTQSACPEYD